MITPQEIKQQAERRYHEFLRSILIDEQFFPLEMRFRKPAARDGYEALRQGIQRLLEHSRDTLGYGYSVELASRNTHLYGLQSLPRRIRIETERDYLKLLNKEQEVAAFRAAVAKSLEQIPSLHGWLAQHPQRLLSYLSVWPELLEVCTYLVQHPRPALYIRELPIPLPTKFVEEHQGILRTLLDALLPPTTIHAEENQFERRYGLRYDEPVVRLRLLDPALQRTLGWPAPDLSFPLAAFAQLSLAGRRVLIAENKMTFLTLPTVPDGVAIWGSGFKVALLREAAWLATCPIWYWGDLDAHGFSILAQLRSCFPHAHSLMMDEGTLAAFRVFVVPGTPSAATALPHLTDSEAALYQELRLSQSRLEQEKIPQPYVTHTLGQMGLLPQG